MHAVYLWGTITFIHFNPCIPCSHLSSHKWPPNMLGQHYISHTMEKIGWYSWIRKADKILLSHPKVEPNMHQLENAEQARTDFWDEISRQRHPVMCFGYFNIIKTQKPKILEGLSRIKSRMWPVDIVSCHVSLSRDTKCLKGEKVQGICLNIRRIMQRVRWDEQHLASAARCSTSSRWRQKCFHVWFCRQRSSWRQHNLQKVTWLWWENRPYLRSCITFFIFICSL